MKRMFYTLVKADHKLGGNTYILGRISGIKSVLCDEDYKIAIANMKKDNGTILSVLTTNEQYEKFTKYIEDIYPDLCIFDYKR